MSPFLIRLGLALPLAIGAGSAARAQGVYGPAGGFYDGYGYAGPAIAGAYVGAPLTRFPRPNEIVPSAWGYGTYGIPTVAGIARSPVGEPAIYVIGARGPAARRGVRKPAWTSPGEPADRRPRGDLTALPQGATGGARIIPVTVPRR